MTIRPQTIFRLDPKLKEKVLIKCIKEKTSIQKLCSDYLKEWVK